LLARQRLESLTKVPVLRTEPRQPQGVNTCACGPGLPWRPPDEPARSFFLSVGTGDDGLGGPDGGQAPKGFSLLLQYAHPWLRLPR